MTSPNRLLHLAYWTGAIVDAAMVVLLLAPGAAGAMLGIDRFAPGPDYRYAAGLCAALMAGWTALLVWADREPVQRRGVLVLTVLPVLVGLFAAGCYAIGSGLVRLAYLAPTLAFQLGASALFLAAYRRARKLARTSGSPAGLDMVAGGQ
ncbi:hypothetical protein KGA66_02040 [Actinocrinis puniceicyclus]|uniref:Transmembrane protein n=1 Tax=Actinocrinis puniceicyclus TaxID=977794 RepID=A0A8J7WKJ1_9ACTN|nr:hypothetical protein [Actinocrinis puniceicyclus]MBS2961812.1 hypothetical protein [Actinocrinis puniceicyclus]